MKLNKSLILSALVASSCLTGASALQAQDTNSAATPPASDAPKPMRARPAGFDMIAKQLDLTDDQKAKVKPIFDDMRTKITALRSDQSLSQEDRRAKMTEIRTATSAQLKDILTPEQYDKWTKMGARGGRPPGGTPPTTSAVPAPSSGTSTN